MQLPVTVEQGQPQIINNKVHLGGSVWGRPSLLTQSFLLIRRFCDLSILDDSHWLRVDGTACKRAFSSDGNDGSRFDRKRLGLVGDQLAQERNQHDERNTDREAAGAKLRKERREPGIFTRFVAPGDRARRRLPFCLNSQARLHPS
jgi:hypothetical protein